MIGENILTARKHAGLTQEALAEAVGVSRQTIAKWEAGESTPDLDMAGALAKALEISLDDLVQIGLPPVGPGMRGKHMFGLVTVGDKGQIVIPVQARRMFDLQPGTQLMVLGDESQGLALVNANFFLEALEVMRHDGK